MPESILAKLKREHKKILSLLDEAERFSKNKKIETFSYVKEMLVAHMEGEEKTLYAHLKNDVRNEVHEDLANEIVEEAREEHHELKQYLQRLNLIEEGSEEWCKELHSLKEHFEQHVSEEETELFDEAREDFSKEELVKFGIEYEKAKESHP